MKIIDLIAPVVLISYMILFSKYYRITEIIIGILFSTILILVFLEEIIIY
jgi:hypothetical protein